jgi:alpha-N-arabinofuranosidase
MIKKVFSMLAIFAGMLVAHGQTAKESKPEVYAVFADQVKAHIAPTMYGIFFEDINMAADGGVYAELVKNRSFEFDVPLAGWTAHKKDVAANTTRDLNKYEALNSMVVLNRGPESPENPRYLRITLPDATTLFGISNEGFRGMGIKEDETYNFSILVRQGEQSTIMLNVELRNADGSVIGKSEISPAGKEWKRYEVKFKAIATANKAQLYIWLSGTGSVDMDMISLFPEHTWKNRPGGLRADLVQKLADLKPGFLRFPGGCIVEGRDLANRYQWKKTLGEIDNRKTIISRWNQEIQGRFMPDYYQSFGLGFMEYFMTAEDIGAEPLPILNCGMACEFNTGEVVPLDQLNPYIQDALDLVEFANGDINTKWGKLRADLGHPKPFNLKMIGVGNEQWGPQYIERWKIFTKAIKDKYPEIKLVSSLGPAPAGAEFDLLNNTFRSLGADILDEHYYQAPGWFLKNANRYDHYDRKGPKIFVGEYAAQSVGTTSPDNKNNWDCALSEAAFMTGLERNADVVNLASYAPLFVHVDAWQWKPDLIWFDNLKSFGTPDYYVQQLFSLNKGTDVVPLLLNNEAVEGQNGCYATACLDKNTNELVIKFVNTTATDKSVKIEIKGSSSYQKPVNVITLGSANKDAENSLTAPTAISPVQSTAGMSGKALNINIEPYSLKVIRIKKA